MTRLDPAFSFSDLFRIRRLSPLNSRRSDSVKRCRNIMREIIIRSISPEDFQELRRLQATEGYLDLGMFEEAAEELRELDPAWFALEQTLSLQLRVFAGLSQPH
jgi:hypothetical protein